MRHFMRAALSAVLAVWATGAGAQTTSATAGVKSIAIGETKTGTLTEADLNDAYEWVMHRYDFQATKGQRVTIDLMSDAFDAYLDVDRRNEDGDQHLEADDDDGDKVNARVVMDIPDTGTYRVNVSSSEHTALGPYRLAIRLGGGLVEKPQDTGEAAEAPRPAPPPPAPIRLGQTVQGRLTETSPLHDDDTPYQGYAFSAKRGQSVTIEQKSTAFDAFLVLLGKDGAVIENDDDGGDNTDARMNAILPSDGDYEIRANATEQDARGAFSLSLAEGPPRIVARPVALAYGQTLRGALEDGDAQAEDGAWFDLYRFRGKARDKVTITLLSDDFDAALALQIADGGRSLADNDDVAETTDAEIQFVLPADAEYEILAKTLRQGEEGRYLIGLSVAPR